MLEVKINATVVGIFICSPFMGEKRILRMYMCKLYFEELEKAKATKILINFLDYVWTQDPCSEIHFLQLKNYPDPKMI